MAVKSEWLETYKAGREDGGSQRVQRDKAVKVGSRLGRGAESGWAWKASVMGSEGGGRKKSIPSG